MLQVYKVKCDKMAGTERPVLGLFKQDRDGIAATEISIPCLI